MSQTYICDDECSSRDGLPAMALRTINIANTRPLARTMSIVHDRHVLTFSIKSEVSCLDENKSSNSDILSEIQAPMQDVKERYDDSLESADSQISLEEHEFHPQKDENVCYAAETLSKSMNKSRSCLNIGHSSNNLTNRAYIGSKVSHSIGLSNSGELAIFAQEL